MVRDRPASVLRDPVLVLPLAVAAGLGVGWEGVRTGMPGGRVAVDLALCWSLVAASLIALQRSRWRRPRVLLALAGLAVLAADLQWFGSAAPWTLGLALEWVWLAVLVQLVLTFPDGRPWSRLARGSIVGGYVAAALGGLASVLVATDGDDALSLFPSESANETIGRVRFAVGSAVLLCTVCLVLWRLTTLAGAARRAQAPLLLGTALALPLLVGTFARQAVTGHNASVTAATTARGMTLLIPLGFVASIAWSRLRRTQAGELVVDLRTGGALTLRDRLARALGDSTLQLAYRLDDGRYVDESGEPVDIGEGRERVVTLLTASDEVVAALVHDPALLDEPALVESVRATAGLVLENERLAATVRAQLTEVRASRARLVAAGDEERRRIERDLHDGAQQRLVALCVSLGLAARHAEPALAETLLRAQDELEQAVADLRALARGIHPTLLREDGLDPALEALARRAPLPVSVEGSSGARLAPQLELAAYFVAMEALTNTVKHAGATSITISVRREPGLLRLQVSDDGLGGARVAPGGGLSGLRDRVEALDGSLVVEAGRTGGTSVVAELPCAS